MILKRKVTAYVGKKDYCFELAKFVSFIDKLDGSSSICLRVIGIFRCFERND